MSGRWAVSTAIALLGALATAAGAQRVSQAGPPVRPLGHIIATTSAPISRVAQVLVLSDGRLLVNDDAGRRVTLFDSTLAHAKSIIDTTGATRRAYGVGPQHLFPYVGDSSLFLDEAAEALVVIDPAGVIVRVMAAPIDPLNPRFGSFFIANPQVVFDRRGHFIIRRQAGQHVHDLDSLLAAPAPGRAIGLDTVLFVDRIDLHGHDDTVTFLTASASYRASGRLLFNPLPEMDQWAVLLDGTLAVLRAHDYHIDWITPDGQVTSSPRIAHQWIHLADSLKVAFLDSARTADSLRTVARFASQGGIEAAAKTFQAGAPGERPPSDSARLAQFRAAVFFQYIPAWLLPDYVPAFSPVALMGAGDANGAALQADADGDLWIRLTSPLITEAGQVFEIVNRQGVLVDRVRIPGGTSIVGFGPGVAYLAAREGTGMQIARARIH